MALVDVSPDLYTFALQLQLTHQNTAGRYEDGQEGFAGSPPEIGQYGLHS